MTVMDQRVRDLKARYDVLSSASSHVPHPLRTCACSWCTLTRDAVALAETLAAELADLAGAL